MNKTVYAVVNDRILFSYCEFKDSMLRIVEVPDFGQSNESVVAQGKAKVKGGDMFAHVHFATTDRNEMAQWLADQQAKAAKWTFTGRNAVLEFSKAIERCTTSIEHQKFVHATGELVKTIADTKPETTGGKIAKAAGLAGIIALACAEAYVAK